MLDPCFEGGKQIVLAIGMRGEPKPLPKLFGPISARAMSHARNQEQAIEIADIRLLASGIGKAFEEGYARFRNSRSS